MKHYLNEDGKTYNGVKLLADISGISADEIKWTFMRLKQLMTVENKPKKEALEIVRIESKTKSWLIK